MSEATKGQQETFDITPVVDQKYPLRMVAMAVGMWEVTQKNWGEFYVRMKLMELNVGGAFLKNGDTGEELPVTPEMARDHIGMVISGAMEERSAWIARIFGNKANELQYAVEKFDGSYEFPYDEDEDKDG